MINQPVGEVDLGLQREDGIVGLLEAAADLFFVRFGELDVMGGERFGVLT